MPSIEFRVPVHIGDVLALRQTEPKASCQSRYGPSPAPEPNGHLDTISVLQKLLGVLDLDVKIIGVNTGRHANLFDFRHMLVFLCLFFLFGLFKAELPVVHDLAHRRVALGSIFTRSKP